jgi:Protein of unknown function (DUF3078)
MRVQVLKPLLVFVFISICLSVSSQVSSNKSGIAAGIIDSLRLKGINPVESPKKPEISLSRDQALKYLQERLHPQFWKNSNDPLRQEFGRLIYEASHPKFDSLKLALQEYPYDSLSIPWEKFYVWEPLTIKIPVISKQVSSLKLDSADTSADDNNLLKSDSLKSSSTSYSKTTVFTKPYVQLKDTTIMVVVDTVDQVSSPRVGFPFKYADNPYQADSIKAAVETLITQIENRDSTIITFTGLGKGATPMMMNSKSDRVIRYWLKNEFSDSVAVWLENPCRNTVGLYLEQGINFRRPGRQSNYSRPKVNAPYIDNKKLLEQRLTIKPQYWRYRTESSFILNQSALSNWVKGGEGSISTALDITAYSSYNNPALKLSSDNFIRFNFGYLKSGQEPVTKNLDLLEANLKLNHVAFGKVYFSAILLFKTQVARGFNYFKTSTGDNASSLVSKFMNPGILTLGLGFDYKPNSSTSINFSPLSYKGTFVTDPAYYNKEYDSTRIDQTQYGVPKDKKALNEPGVSFMISNEFKPTKSLTFVNRLQLFTNYIHNPQNVDVDWEMIATAHLNWFTDVRFNTHLIFDDDTKTPQLDSKGQSILLADGSEKKTARIQFKELLGISLSFRF